MSETAENKPGLFDQFLNYSSRLGDVYQKVRLADQGVAVGHVVETNGANAPLVVSGQPASVRANDPLADALNNVTNKAAMAYSAKQFSDSMPYIMGMTAAVIAIWVLTRKG